jgi:hypothetical protein
MKSEIHEINKFLLDQKRSSTPRGVEKLKMYREKIYQRALKTLEAEGIDLAELSISDQNDLKHYVELTSSEKYIPKELARIGDYNPALEAAALWLKDLGLSFKESSERFIERPTVVEVLDEEGKIVKRLIYYTSIESEQEDFIEELNRLEEAHVKYQILESGAETRDEYRAMVRHLSSTFQNTPQLCCGDEWFKRVFLRS